jgi:integrase
LRFRRDDQIDGDVWIVLGEAMKAPKDRTPDFRVPLVPVALDVIDQARRHARDGFLFPSIRKGVIPGATMSRFMEGQGPEARPHGFRSRLGDRLAEDTDAALEVAETILGPTVGGTLARTCR